MSEHSNLALAIWYVFLALAICLVIAVVYVLPAGSVELSITGYSVGQGHQNLSFCGDALNISLTQNSTYQGWSIVLEAAA